GRAAGRGSLAGAQLARHPCVRRQVPARRTLRYRVRCRYPADRGGKAKSGRGGTTTDMMDLYGRLLSSTLFPAFEALRGRPTVPLLRYLLETQYWSASDLRELQLRLLRRLLRHAYHYTSHYHDVLAGRGMVPADFTSLADLEKLPLLDRATLRATMTARTAYAP